MRFLSSFACCFLWLASAPAIAQNTTAELAGSVTDPSGAAIAKAKVERRKRNAANRQINAELQILRRGF